MTCSDSSVVLVNFQARSTSQRHSDRSTHVVNRLDFSRTLEFETMDETKKRSAPSRASRMVGAALVMAACSSALWVSAGLSAEPCEAGQGQVTILGEGVVFIGEASGGIALPVRGKCLDEGETTLAMISENSRQRKTIIVQQNGHELVTFEATPPAPRASKAQPVSPGVSVTANPSVEQWAVIPAGQFNASYTQMNLSEVRRQFKPVTLTRPFLMQTTEVTRAQWKRMMGAANYPNENNRVGGMDRPVMGIGWTEALFYANARSKAEGVEACYELSQCEGRFADEKKIFACEQITFKGLDCKGYRLPTNVEWEYAARAGTTTNTYNGEMSYYGKFENKHWRSLYEGLKSPGVLSKQLDTIAWYGGSSEPAGRFTCNPYSKKTCFQPKPVGKKKPNAWGLYDMLGNLSEFVWDGFIGESAFRGGVDPIDQDASERVGVLGLTVRSRTARGCDIASPASMCDIGSRMAVTSYGRHDGEYGFRLVRTLPKTHTTHKIVASSLDPSKKGPWVDQQEVTRARARFKKNWAGRIKRRDAERAARRQLPF